VSIARPAAEVSIGARRLSGPAAGVTGVRVELGTGSAHDAFRVAVFPGSAALSARPGDEAEIAVGYGDSPDTVLTGIVTAVQRSTRGGTVEGLAATWSLSGARVARSFVRVDVATIVGELLDAAGASAGVIDAPAKLAAFHVDERRTVWSHLQTLADLSGSEVSAAPDGSLNFRPVRSPAIAPARLRYGAEVVSWELLRRDPEHLAFTVAASGAASEDGEEKWHLLTREPEGAGPAKPVQYSAALADREAARAQERALRAAAARTARGGTVVVVGDPSVRAGDVVDVGDLPGGAGGTFRVARVTHELAADAGFLTHLAVEAAA
jgi:hypothetical protein